MGEGVICNQCSESKRQRLASCVQARHIRHIQHLHVLVDALHETAQRGAGAELDEAREALREQVAHGRFPEH